MGRRGEVVQNQKATGSKQLDDLLGVVTLAPTVAEEDIERGVLLKQPPVPGKHADTVVVREHPSSPTGNLLVTLHGDQPGTRPQPTVQPGGTQPKPVPLSATTPWGFAAAATLSNLPTSGTQLLVNPASEARRSAATTRDGTARSVMITNPPGRAQKKDRSPNLLMPTHANRLGDLLLSCRGGGI